MGGAVGMLRAGLGGSGQVQCICNQLIHQDAPSRPPLTPKITIIVHPHTEPRPPVKNVISDHYATPISNFDMYGTPGFIAASTDVEHANKDLGGVMCHARAGTLKNGSVGPNFSQRSALFLRACFYYKSNY